MLANAPAQPTIRQNNVTQISERDATVSGTQEESDAAGKGSEMAHQMALASKVLKSDMETILCSRQARNDGNDTGPTARTTEAFSHWVARAKDKLGNPLAAIAPGTVTTGVPVLATDAFAAPRHAGSDHRGDARRRDATGLHQRREPDLVDRAARARSGRFRPSSAGRPRKSWSARPKSSRPSM